MPLTEIEKLDALGREHGFVIYAVHQANAGWGCQWYEGGDYGVSSPVTGRVGLEWRQRLVVYGYYPTIAEMVEQETKRLELLRR